MNRSVNALNQEVYNIPEDLDDSDGIVNFLSKKGLMDSSLKFRSMTLPDIFIDQDTPDNMYKIANLDCSSIEEKVLDVLNSNIILQKQK